MTVKVILWACKVCGTIVLDLSVLMRRTLLCGWYSSQDPASREICVLCHGLLGSKDNGIIKKLGEGLPANTCR